MDAAALQIYCGDEMTATTPPARGVGWVLCWAMALAMLVFAALVLTSFAYQVAAEHAIRQAATAGLREATLPRATSASVESAVRSRLSTHGRLRRIARIQLDRSGVPVRGAIGTGDGAQLSLTLTAAAAELAPRWLAFLSGDSLVTIRAKESL
jgi:hypothetical protein